MADPSTQSNYLDICTEQVAFDWNVDFHKKIINGSATHKMIVRKEGVNEVIFDTADLDISTIEVDGKATQFDLHSAAVAGEGANARENVFRTCLANANQFTLVPLHHSKRYTAKVSSVLPVLLSAIRVSPPSDGPAHGGKVIGKDLLTYVYNQPVPIPPYLIAIAVGNVQYRAFPKPDGKQWTTGLWAEPEMIDSAFWEFSEDTARFLAAAEKLVIPYKFGVYDLLVLPPAFPYGGMENACLTFLTPTLLTGDRALVDVVVHELTHSWFGNGVTHANPSHFWLNEGWTTYIERLLLQVLHSPAERGFSFVIGQKALVDSLKLYEDRPKYQRLVIDFEVGEDPDDAYSSIAYEKGANLILHLERTLGGLDVFIPYIRDYVETYIGKSITTEQWKDHLYGYFTKNGGPLKIKALDSVDWNAWLYGEGLKLPVEMEYDLTLARQAYELAEKWDASRKTEISKLEFKESDLSNFNTNQTIVFLERLQTYDALPSDLTLHLGTLYRLSTTQNAELRFRFYQVALADTLSPAATSLAIEAAKWVVGNDGTGVIKGRMKFCRPVFRAVSKVDQALAIETWEKSKMSFFPSIRKRIEQDIGITDAKK